MTFTVLRAVLEIFKDGVFTAAGCIAISWVMFYVIDSVLETIKSVVNNLCMITAVGKLFFEFVRNYEDFKLYRKDVEAWDTEQERRAKNG